MRRAAEILAAYLAACVAVSIVWLVVAWFDSNGRIAGDGLVWFFFFVTGMIAAFSAIPAAILLLLLHYYDGPTLGESAIAGAIVGAGLFVWVFGQWNDSSGFRAFAEMVIIGGALGAVGGAVYHLVRTALSRRRRSA